MYIRVSYHTKRLRGEECEELTGRGMVFARPSLNFVVTFCRNGSGIENLEAFLGDCIHT